MVLFIIGCLLGISGYYFKLFEYKKYKLKSVNFFDTNILAIVSNMLLVFSGVIFIKVVDIIILTRGSSIELLNNWFVGYIIIPSVIMFLMLICVNYFAYAQSKVKESN